MLASWVLLLPMVGQWELGAMGANRRSSNRAGIVRMVRCSAVQGSSGAGLPAVPSCSGRQNSLDNSLDTRLMGQD